MNILLLSPVNPAKEDSGFKLAVWSDIVAIQSFGAHITVLCSCFSGEEDDVSTLENVQFDYEPTKKGGRITRFIRSLLSKMPASVERYYTTEMREKIKYYLKNNEYDLVVIEDVSLSRWIDLIKGLSPSSRIIVRSHNFMHEVTRLQYKSASLILKPLLFMEHLRWTALERYSIKHSDTVWAITDIERQLLCDFYNFSECYYAPVSIDIDKYLPIDVEDGNAQWISHLGTLDMKKSPGMLYFIKNVWPVMCSKNNNLELHLGGKVTSSSIKKCGTVTLHGYVENDVDFYKNSRFSLNSQTIGAGVKLKSLVALASGRVLLSTTIGVEGLNIEHGKHYLNYERLLKDDGFEFISSTCNDIFNISRAGREWVVKNHSRVVVSEVISKLLT